MIALSSKARVPERLACDLIVRGRSRINVDNDPSAHLSFGGSAVACDRDTFLRMLTELRIFAGKPRPDLWAA